MSRTRLGTTPTIEAQKDNGNLRLSVVRGEQISTQFTLNWLTNLSGATIRVNYSELDNTSRTNADPPDPLVFVDSDVWSTFAIWNDSDDSEISGGEFSDSYTSKSFNFLIDSEFGSDLVQPSAPRPGIPSWYAWELEVRESGGHIIRKPARGLIELLAGRP